MMRPAAVPASSSSSASSKFDDRVRRGGGGGGVSADVASSPSMSAVNHSSSSTATAAAVVSVTPSPPPLPPRHDDDHNDDEVDDGDGHRRSSSAYPTASTVPFPYERPYQVQIDLMDTMLTALKMRDDIDEGGEDETDEGDNDDGDSYVRDGCESIGIGGGGGSGCCQELARGDDRECCGGANAKKKKKIRRRHRASVVFLESPTGTGKSLSLAAASLSWLTYRESRDLQRRGLSSESSSSAAAAKTTASTTGAAGAVSAPTSTSTTTSSSGLDWLDSWVSPAELEQRRLRDQREKLRAEAIETAHRARQHLECSLNDIRLKLDRGPAGGGSGAGGRSSANRERTLRENLARNAVTKALVAERRRQRKERAASARNNNKAKGKGRVIKKKVCGRVGDMKVEDVEEEDFCVDEYKSDDDEANDSDSSSSDESDDDDDGDTTLETLRAKATAASLSPGELLDGGNLDGSGYTRDIRRRRKFRSRDNNGNNGGGHLDDSSSSAAQPLRPPVADVVPGSGVRKIVYAARTHSQLSQFVSELKRVPRPPQQQRSGEKGGGQSSDSRPVRVVALGGRSLLCGNPDVVKARGGKRRSDAAVTERCLDLQKSTSKKSTTATAKEKADAKAAGQKRKVAAEDDAAKKATTGPCPFLASSDAVSALALHGLAKPSDIEDLAKLGQASRACAYYASRESLAAAEVVVLPYNTLLSKEARAAVGLSLKKSLVIIDEAHNIPEALRSLSSCKLTLPVAEAALAQMMAYAKRYSTRLAGRNLFYLGQIRRCLAAIIKFLKKKPPAAQTASSSSSSTTSPAASMMSATELLFALKLDNVNLFKILRYLEKSRLPQKLLGFTNFTTNASSMSAGPKEAEDDPDFISKHISSMSVVQTFLSRLTSTGREGKVVAEWPDDINDDAVDARPLRGARHPALRYVMLNPAAKFDDVLDEAHAVVLAGGTLRPFSHVAAELMGSDAVAMQAAVDAEKVAAEKTIESPSVSSLSPTLTAFSCGHVVPSSHVLTTCLSVGPTSTKLDFRHSSRSSDATCDELGRVLVNLSNVVPSGMVVFLPSYSYEAHLVRRWRTTGLLDQLKKRKKVHREPKNSREVESALEVYSKDAISSQGALLLSVVGGKMSEGINFANDMARCVVVVGLPYPDITDPELREKMQSLDNAVRERKCGISGQAYYHNLCMRAVNQSIGRAIRHSNDYAAVVLADARYASEPRIWRALPQWLRGGDERAPQEQSKSFGKAIVGLRNFFNQRHSSVK